MGKVKQILFIVLVLIGNAGNGQDVSQAKYELGFQVTPRRTVSSDYRNPCLAFSGGLNFTYQSNKRVRFKLAVRCEDNIFYGEQFSEYQTFLTHGAEMTWLMTFVEYVHQRQWSIPLTFSFLTSEKKISPVVGAGIGLLIPTYESTKLIDPYDLQRQSIFRPIKSVPTEFNEVYVLGEINSGLVMRFGHITTDMRLRAALGKGVFSLGVECGVSYRFGSNREITA